jgi:ComF family protein
MLFKNVAFLKEQLSKIQNWLLPSVCLLCSVSSKRSVNLCQACENDLPWLQQSCSVCAMPLSVNTTEQPLICGQCLQQPPAFSTVTALFHYQPPVDNFITALKFNQQLLYAKLFGELLTTRLQQHYQQQQLPELIMPVPLHPQRLRERGFNQALEIARPIAKQLKLPLAINSCERIRLTVAQSSLPATERQANVKNAFKINSTFKGKHVAIIDDVITTGHTIAELSKTLRKSGVERIDVWSVARTNMRV